MDPGARQPPVRRVPLEPDLVLCARPPRDVTAGRRGDPEHGARAVHLFEVERRVADDLTVERWRAREDSAGAAEAHGVGADVRAFIVRGLPLHQIVAESLAPALL